MLLTLVNVPLLEIPEAFSRVLPSSAYRGIPYTKVKDADGKEREMTDIKPAYFVEAMNNTFGMAGYGWRYEYDEMIAEYDKGAFNGKGGWEITISNLRLYYKYTDGEQVYESMPIVASGGAFMQKRVHAERGAITNAIGSAGAKMGWQSWIYKGIIHHSNCSAALARQEKLDEELLASGGRIPGTPIEVK
jgi:hypothetical protein